MSATKENDPTLSLGQTMSSGNLDNPFISPSSARLAADADRPMMLSPPPEEELRSFRHMNNEPGSASRPLKPSVRSNQPLLDLQPAKRKRTVGNKDTPPRPTAKDAAQQPAYTPNPRLRKQIRQSSHSPTASVFPDGAPMLLHPESPEAGEGPPRMLEDTVMSPIRKGKSRSKGSLLVPQSPHAANPSADYIPPSHLAVSVAGTSYRRRSVTPIPPYEPPTERFTPPREIFSTPLGPEKKPAKRAPPKKKGAAGKGKDVEAKPKNSQLRIKTEPPEVDLTAPLPPPSPGDDPILLVGPPPKRIERSPTAEIRHASLVGFEMDMDLPARESSPRRSSPFDSDSFLNGPVPPVFDFGMDDTGFVGGSGGAGDGWSDSDDDPNDAIEGEGDFTGKFYAFTVPTKMDPPTSATRDRMEEWGRPISPHPRRLSFGSETDIGEIEDHEMENDNHQGDKVLEEVDNPAIRPDSEKSQDEEDEEDRGGYKDGRGRRLTLSELEAKKFGNQQTPSRADVADDSRDNSRLETDGFAEEQIENDFDQGDNNLNNSLLDTSAETEEQSSGELEAQVVLVDEDNSIELNGLETAAHNNEPEDSGQALDFYEADDTSTFDVHAQEHPSYLNHLELEQSFTRSTFRDTLEKSQSQELESDRGATPEDIEVPTQETSQSTGVLGLEPEAETAPGDADDDGESDSDDSDVSVVKIVSKDPMAAARAAAILKMHDYDMIAKKLRRKSTAEGGVLKSYGTPQKSQKWRRRTIAGLAAEDHLSANVTLPELLERVEQELRNTPVKSRSGSVSIAGTPTQSRQEEQFGWELPATSGPREWTKADWKLLDSCFTDERHDVAHQKGLPLGVLCDSDEVEPPNVVERFLDLMGGSAVVGSLGPSWTSEKLLQRVRALCKRQRLGRGAPATPEVSSRFSTLSPSSSMIVPDFTPTPAERIRRFGQGVPGGKPSLPQDAADTLFKAPFPPSMLAPRYSHLREEAFASYSEASHSGNESSATSEDEIGDNDSQQSDAVSVNHEDGIVSTPATPTRSHEQQEPMSAVKRSLTYIGSWLRPGMFKPRQEQRRPMLPGLPVPPSDVLAKPRGPVTTPARKPVAKVAPPKEQVTLQPAPPLQPTKIPRAVPPRRLVELQHIPTPPPKPLAKAIPRRSSTTSVKDLVKDFETMEKVAVRAIPPRVAELRKMRSADSFKSKSGSQGKPTWKP